MSYRDDTIKQQFCNGPAMAILWEVQEKLPAVLREIQAARHSGRSQEDITRALWPLSSDVDCGGRP